MDLWNANVWCEKFLKASELAGKGDWSAKACLRQLRVEVFENTIDAIDKGGYETESGKHISLPDLTKLEKQALFYQTPFDVNDVEALQEETVVSVENIDCLLAAEKLQKDGYNPAVLNMANRSTPGGGVCSGAGAQEENICRRSILYPTLLQFKNKLSSEAYPMDRNFGGIYSPNILVVRAEECRGYAWLEEPFTTSFISVAGINRPSLTLEGRLTPHMIVGTKNKIRTIFRIGLRHKHDSLVLGALGCGAFRNPPDHIAELFKEVMDEAEFKNKFKRIVFAIIEDHNSHHRHNPRGNFIPFQECFSTTTSLKDSVKVDCERENYEIFESLAKVVHIIMKKCTRCDSIYGCMGCEFDSLAGPIVPMVEDAFLSFADHHKVPIHLEHFYKKAMLHSKERDALFKR